MYYKEEFDNLNNFIEVVSKINNKFYKLAIKICYNNFNN